MTDDYELLARAGYYDQEEEPIDPLTTAEFYQVVRSATSEDVERLAVQDWRSVRGDNRVMYKVCDTCYVSKIYRSHLGTSFCRNCAYINGQKE